MMTRSPRTLLLPALLALLAPAGAGAEAKALKGAALLSHATVRLPQARRTALAARPGRVVDEELEREKGGSGYRYSFDVASRGRVYEVGVDARTGRVLENAAEGAHPD